MSRHSHKQSHMAKRMSAEKSRLSNMKSFIFHSHKAQKQRLKVKLIMSTFNN